jgi:hypothetical protein
LSVWGSQEAIAKPEEDFMFAKHHILTQLSRALAIAAVLAAVAVSSAAAGTSSSGRTRDQACQGPVSTWITITDDLGIPSLQQTGPTACTDALACTPTTAVATRSGYPGWAFTTDSLGRPWLVPVAKSEAAGSGPCLLKQPGSAAAATTVKSGTPANRRIVRSPYPGWVYVTDEDGPENLVSISDIRG